MVFVGRERAFRLDFNVFSLFLATTSASLRVSISIFPSQQKKIFTFGRIYFPHRKKIDGSKISSQNVCKSALVAETNNAYKMLVVEHGTISKMGPKSQFNGAGTEFENPLYFYLHLGRASR